MLSLNERLRPNADVVDTEIEDSEVALLHLQSKTYFSLNSTGARIWAGLKEGSTLGEISQRLQTEFDVSAAQAEQSVLSLAEELIRLQLADRQ